MFIVALQNINSKDIPHRELGSTIWNILDLK